MPLQVRGELQGKSIRSALMTYIERVLKDPDNRILIIDTSGDPAFELTCKFYMNLDYNHVAFIPEFWSEKEDKVVFWKKL